MSERKWENESVEKKNMFDFTNAYFVPFIIDIDLMVWNTTSMYICYNDNNSVLFVLLRLYKNHWLCKDNYK